MIRDQSMDPNLPISVLRRTAWVTCLYPQQNLYFPTVFVIHIMLYYSCFPLPLVTISPSSLRTLSLFVIG